MINLGNGIIRNTRSPGYRLVEKGVKKVSNALTSPAAHSKLNKKRLFIFCLLHLACLSTRDYQGMLHPKGVQSNPPLRTPA